MLCALDDMQAIWTLSFIDGHKKAGSEFNDFCVESPLIVIQLANFLYVQAAHHAYIDVKARDMILLANVSSIKSLDWLESRDCCSVLGFLLKNFWVNFSHTD